MPRCGRLRSFIREYNESPNNKKLSFLPPFIILTLEIILIIHAILTNEINIIIITSILVVISVIEIILVTREIHAHYINDNFDRVLTIKLDDFIIEKNEKNVRKIVEEFINENPQYSSQRSQIYHISCQILETHVEEAQEKELTNKLRDFINKNKDLNVDDIVEKFVKTNQKFKKNRSMVYKKTCEIKGEK